jgi:rubrerythrin
LYPYAYRPAPANPDARLVPDIAKAIDGQYSAIICYEQLARMAPNEEQRTRILEIRQDEERHYRMFTRLYRALTGTTHSPKLGEPCPSEYIAGLRAALVDEQQTVDFYHEIADRSQTPAVREQFRRAAFDEQNHAVWFLYFYTLNR